MTRRETQSSVTLWAEETFGEADVVRILGRANEEMAELIRCLTSNPRHPQAPEEAADTLITLYRPATILGFDLLAEATTHRERIGTKTDYEISPFECACIANCKLSKILLRVSGGSYFSNGGLADRAMRDDFGAVAYFLSLTCYGLGGDLLVSVDDKMAVNRQRQWNVDEKGVGYHVRPGSAAAARA